MGKFIIGKSMIRELIIGKIMIIGEGIAVWKFTLGKLRVHACAYNQGNRA